MRNRQISLSLAILLLTLSFSSCRTQQLVAGENAVTITKEQSTGCRITVANPQYPEKKDPKVSAGLLASSIEQLQFTADANYPISFPEGSPLQNTPTTIYSGTHSFLISFAARLCATFSSTGKKCQYKFYIYDPNDPTKTCDPIVHVTK